MQSRPLFWQSDVKPEHEAFLPMDAWRQFGMEEGIMQELEDYYKTITPKYPEKWNPKIY